MNITRFLDFINTIFDFTKNHIFITFLVIFALFNIISNSSIHKSHKSYLKYLKSIKKEYQKSLKAKDKQPTLSREYHSLLHDSISDNNIQSTTLQLADEQKLSNDMATMETNE